MTAILRFDDDHIDRFELGFVCELLEQDKVGRWLVEQGSLGL
ncbi:hypothetical protein QNI23_017245 (plasmid) [Bermanella sp. WJH001]|nr:hypothetical protein [Bermanella sp. WJH001]MDJ1539497.1 hypothetical protein [Bermanella sp. WJH001]